MRFLFNKKGQIYWPWWPGPGCQQPAWVPPTYAQFQAQFFRDFPYAPLDDNTSLNFVQPIDITNAINLANADFNPGLFGTNAVLIFMYLAAHYLVLALRNSSMGLNSQAKFPLDASSVGGVSISNNINERFANDANFAKYLTTGYGQMYITLAYPYTVGAGTGIAIGTVGPA